MPVYEYLNKATGEHVELVRTVDERDQVPAELQRVTVPRRIAIHGSSSSPRDPDDADSQVPAAFRQMEQTMAAREIVQESGFSINETKEIWGM